jgi:hypothetical protein
MGVNVDEAGGYDAVAGIDLLGPAARYLPDCGDFSAAKADVADEGRGAAPVKNQPAAHDQIEVHKPLLEARRPRPGGSSLALPLSAIRETAPDCKRGRAEDVGVLRWQGGAGS